MRQVAFFILLMGCIAPAAAREVVSFDGYYPGSVVVDTSARKLYYVTRLGEAIRYPVGVGRRGKQWAGTTFVSDKRVRPAWSPPPAVKREEPWLPDVVLPGPDNPMGSRALLLEGGEYAIHGTNKPETVGGFVSYGCFRMYNEDIEDLYRRVEVGTPVIVMR